MGLIGVLFVTIIVSWLGKVYFHLHYLLLVDRDFWPYKHWYELLIAIFLRDTTSAQPHKNIGAFDSFAYASSDLILPIFNKYHRAETDLAKRYAWTIYGLLIILYASITVFLGLLITSDEQFVDKIQGQWLIAILWMIEVITLLVLYRMRSRQIKEFVNEMARGNEKGFYDPGLKKSPAWMKQELYLKSISADLPGFGDLIYPLKRHFAHLAKTQTAITIEKGVNNNSFLIILLYLIIFLTTMYLLA